MTDFYARAATRLGITRQEAKERLWPTLYMRDLDTPTWQRRQNLEQPPDPIEGVGTPRIVAPNPVPGNSPISFSHPPRKEGWYWNRKHGHEPVVLFVFEVGGYFYALDPSGKSQWDVRLMRDCEWAGPLENPFNV